MTANELSKILSQAASLLEMYEGKDVQHVLSDLIKLKSRSTEKRTEVPKPKITSAQLDKTKLKGIATWLEHATLKEVQHTIESDEVFRSNENVRLLAKYIGLSVGPRQNRDALIQTLLSHLDRTRMHRIISERNRNTTETSESISTPTEESEQVTEAQKSNPT